MTSDNHIDPEAFGTEIERMEQITNIDWDEIFRDLDELTPKGYYVRMILSNQIRYGSSQWAHDTPRPSRSLSKTASSKLTTTTTATPS
jgi:hypothetical protein